MTNLTINDPLYDRNKTSDYISLNITTLDKWVSNKKFPKPDLKIGKKPMWKLSTINKFINNTKLYQENL